MASNRGVVFLGANDVEIQSIDYPKLENPAGPTPSPPGS
jgi:glutathione-independent formaldehyde dehydrogenase